MDFVVLSLFALLAFISRVVNLLEVPIFTDEAIYIRWAQIGLNDPAHRFISLTDGKQPLFTWLMYPFLSIFTDPLFAGRFVSVLSSMLAVSGIYFLAKELFNRKTAVFACILYLISPFALLYDRLALMDSLLSALLVWCLYFTVAHQIQPSLFQFYAGNNRRIWTPYKIISRFRSLSFAILASSF